MSIENSGYQLGDGAFHIQSGDKIHTKLSDQQYADLNKFADENGLDFSGVGSSFNPAEIYDVYAGLDLEFNYIATDEDIQLGKDFNLSGNIQDFAGALTDKFMEKTFLEPIMNEIIDDAKKFQERIKKNKY